MVGDRGWDALGLKPSRDGWLSEDPELTDRLVRESPLGMASLGVWLKRDLRSAKVWALWAFAAGAIALGLLWRDKPAVALGVAVAGFYLWLLWPMVRMFGWGRLQTGIVRAVEAHPAPGQATVLLEGSSTRVGMKENVAQTALTRLGRFEVLFFEEKDPRAWAFEVAFRPLPAGAPKS